MNSSARGQSLQGLISFLASNQRRQRYGSTFRFLGELIRALPIKSTPDTLEIWNTDHAGALMGMLNEGFVHANCEALKELIEACGADVIVDFWNPFAVIAARFLQKPIVTVIQADAHPASQGFIWWKTPPAAIPTPVPVVNKVLADYNLPPIGALSELSVGDLTLVVGMPETDPLPDSADVTYIGPILWQKQGAKLPDWIDHLSKDRPLVWVYPGNPRYASSGKTLELDRGSAILHRRTGWRRGKCRLDYRLSPASKTSAAFTFQLLPRTVHFRPGDGREE